MKELFSRIVFVLVIGTTAVFKETIACLLLSKKITPVRK